MITFKNKVEGEKFKVSSRRSKYGEVILPKEYENKNIKAIILNNNRGINEVHNCLVKSKNKECSILLPYYLYGLDCLIVDESEPINIEINYNDSTIIDKDINPSSKVPFILVPFKYVGLDAIGISYYDDKYNDVCEIKRSFVKPHGNGAKVALNNNFRDRKCRLVIYDSY